MFPILRSNVLFKGSQPDPVNEVVLQYRTPKSRNFLGPTPAKRTATPLPIFMVLDHHVSASSFLLLVVLIVDRHTPVLPRHAMAELPRYYMKIRLTSMSYERPEANIIISILGHFMVLWLALRALQHFVLAGKLRVFLNRFASTP